MKMKFVSFVSALILAVTLAACGKDDSAKSASEQAKESMEKAAKDLDFMEAARLRDLMFEAKAKLETLK